jgi:hypothetical protein
MAYGSNPDVNPVFAFFVVAATASLLRSLRSTQSGLGTDGSWLRRNWFWLLTSWLCLALASWMRFDTLVLVPALAALLLPRWRLALGFAVAAVLPLVLWNVADSILTQQAGRVMQVVSRDPTLEGSILSVGFSFLGAVWQTVTLPLLVLGLAGALRAMRHGRGRGWIVPALAHGAAFTGTTLVFHAGTQPRYFILIASIWAALAGVALAGILARSRFVGWSMVFLAALLLAWTPGWYPGNNFLWARRNPELRVIVDDVAARVGEAHVVWVAEESAYLYFCRIRPPLQRYHGLPRHDSDLQTVVDGLEDAQEAFACVQQASRPLLRWQKLLERVSGSWHVQLLEDRGTYRVFSMRRLPQDD